jgi:acyl-CoA thioesterase-1
MSLLWGSLFFFSIQSIEAETIKAGKKVMIFGDSLTAGYQLPSQASFPAVLERYLKDADHQVEVINASVSGDTATAGLERLEWSLTDRPDLVILELGANDMLRGIDVAVTYDALDSILNVLRDKQVPVLLAGMKASRGLGNEYRRNFETIYPNLAKKYGIKLYPFFLEGVAERPELNLSDGLHPNAAGVQHIVNRIGPFIIEMLGELEGKTQKN